MPPCCAFQSTGNDAYEENVGMVICFLDECTPGHRTATLDTCQTTNAMCQVTWVEQHSPNIKTKQLNLIIQIQKVSSRLGEKMCIFCCYSMYSACILWLLAWSILSIVWTQVSCPSCFLYTFYRAASVLRTSRSTLRYAFAYYERITQCSYYAIMPGRKHTKTS